MKTISFATGKAVPMETAPGVSPGQAQAATRATLAAPERVPDMSYDGAAT
ncbi:hypothetical protein ACU4GI_36515 [Cupriavidus basilensis]